MSSHHRSGGPPALMSDVHDFDRNFHSHRFDNNRGGRGRGRMRGRGGGGEGGGMRGGRGDGGFIPRGGRGDFYQRDRFNNNNHFNRPNDEQRGGHSKMPSLLDVDQQQSRPFDRDNNRNGGRGRMPYPRGRGGGRDSPGDDRYRHSGSKSSSSDGPPPLLDFGNDKPGLPPNVSNNSLPSLLSVQLENSGVPTPGSDSSKSIDTHKDHPHGDNSSTRSDDHSSHRDNDRRYRDRESNRGDLNRSSSFNRDRSRSPRDRDRDRHGPPRDDHSFGGDYRRGGRGGRGGGGDHFGRGGRGDYHNNQREPHQSRFGPDNNQQPWQDRRGGGRGGGRGGFHDRPRDMPGHHRPNEQLPPDNHPFHRDGRPNFDAPPSQNRPFQENFPPGNYEAMGPPPHNRSNLHPPPNFNQGPPPNRPDFYPPNPNNSPYQPHNTRIGGRPSRFSDRQDDYEDDRPLTKPNFSLPNATATTTPLYINQPTNPTFSQPRPPMSSTFSSQQPSSAMYHQGGPTHMQPPPPQFGWPNQQQGAPNPHMAQSLLSLASNDQQNPNLSGHPPPNTFYGTNNDFYRQQQQQQQQQIPPSANPYYGGVPPVPPQTGIKPPNMNAQPTPVSMPPSQQQQQQMPPTGATNTAEATANASSAEAWKQYYQKYWEYMQQQQQAGVQLPSTQTGAQQQFSQSQTGSATVPKQPTNPASATGNTQDAAMTQASTEAWTQYWMQCQAFAHHQQQQQSQAPSSTNSTTIAAPSQLYPQAPGKPQQNQPSSAVSSNPNASSGAPSVSNWQTWFNPKG